MSVLAGKTLCIAAATERAWGFHSFSAGLLFPHRLAASIVERCATEWTGKEPLFALLLDMAKESVTIGIQALFETAHAGNIVRNLERLRNNFPYHARDFLYPTSARTSRFT